MISRVCRFALILPLLAVLLLAACDGLFTDDTELVERARDYLQQRQARAAAIELSNALQDNPDNAEARYLLGKINLDYGDWPVAAQEFRFAAMDGWNEGEAASGLSSALLGAADFRELIDTIKVKDSYSPVVRADLLAMRAMAEGGLGETEQSRKTLASATALNPEAFHVYRTGILMEIAAGKHAAARKLLEAALARYPENPELLLLDANVRILEDDTRAASDLYHRVIDHDPVDLITDYGRRARIGLAQLLIQAQDLQQADDILRPLFGRNPGDPHINYLGALIAFSRGDYDLAERRLLKVLKLAPGHLPTRLLYGTVNFAQGDYEQAAYFLSKYLAKVPDNFAARKLLGRSYLMLGRYDEANQELQSALLGAGDDAELLALVGLSEIRRGDITAGIQGLEKAKKDDPDNLAIRGSLARAYLSADDTGQAIRELQNLLEKGGKQKQVEAMLVIARLRGGEYDHAISLVLGMLGGYPEDPAVMTLAGNVFTVAGDRPEGRRYYEKVLQANPGYPPATLALAWIEEQDGHTDRARAMYKGLVDTGTGSILPMLALARLAEHRHDRETANAWLGKAHDSKPLDIRPLMLKAEYALMQGQTADSEQQVREALRIEPLNRHLRTLLGRVLLSERRYAEAREIFTGLLTGSPDDSVARTLLAESDLMLQNPGQARENLDLVLEKDPYYIPALVLMIQLQVDSGSPGEALEYCRKIQRIKPDQALGYKLAGDLWMLRRDPARAREAYTTAWEKQHTGQLAIMLSSIAQISGDEREVEEPLLTWLDRHPDDNRVREYLGTVYLNSDRQAAAVQEYETVLLTDPGNLLILNNLAWLYLSSDRPRALELAEKAYRIEHDNPDVLDTYGWILVQDGQVPKGRRLLERAMEKLPDKPGVQYHYAVALAGSGDRDRARKLLAQLLADTDDRFAERRAAEQFLAGLQ